MMRRQYIVAPIAVLSGACTLRPFTPSVSVAYWSENVPMPVRRDLPTANDAMLRWQLQPDNPWARYGKFTLLASLDVTEISALLPDVRSLETVRMAECAAQRVASVGVPEHAAWIVDLRGAASVEFGASLSQLARTPIAPVITFNNWPAQEEIVPAEETLSALITMSPRLPAAGATDPTTPVFLLDAWRLAYRFDEVDDEIVDNRYALTVADLPSGEELRARGIDQVIYVVEHLHDTNVEEDDLHDTMLDYQASGVRLTMIDLSWLCGLGSSAPRDWTPMLRDYGYRVVPRETLLQNPEFFVRARAGFGGIHAGPSPWRGGGGFHANHGGG